MTGSCAFAHFPVYTSLSYATNPRRHFYICAWCGQRGDERLPEGKNWQDIDEQLYIDTLRRFGHDGDADEMQGMLKRIEERRGERKLD